jgi:short-subunit dehydrogenase involved in D-alanine esterification of teichoic acids
VTGGDLGIGLEVSKALALSRARVLILSRKEEHGEEAIAKIKEVHMNRMSSWFSVNWKH